MAPARRPNITRLRRILAGPVEQAAVALLGCRLVHHTEAGKLEGVIVEVEAYDQREPACHAFAGRTAKNANLFAAPGHAYVYISYGMHFCVNVTTGPAGFGAAVLLRALAPAAGMARMFALRRRPRLDALAQHALCRGPGNLCQAMGIARTFDGIDLLSQTSALRLVPKDARDVSPPIMASPRIGISRATQLMWRFFYAGVQDVSGARHKRAVPLGAGPERL